MAVIQGGASGALNDVDPVNLGGRASACDVQGGVYNRPLFSTKIYNPRVTTAIAAGSFLWAIRSQPASKSLYIVGGHLSLVLDTVAAVEVGIEIVRFSGANFTGGTALTPFRMDTSQSPSVGPDIRHGSATAGLTVGAAVVDATTQALLSESTPFNAGSNSRIGIDCGTLWGLRLQPGEGLVVRCNPTAAPIGLTLGGFLVWGEAA